jgi:hypothetical protein
MRNKPKRTKKPKGKKRNRGLSVPELARRIARRTALVEAQQAAMRERTKSPSYTARAAATAKGLAKQKARLSMKLELRAARRMRKALAYQRKRYKEHKREFIRKVTWEMRASWKLTTDAWQELRTAMKEAEQRLRSATKAYEDVTVGAQRNRDITAGWKLGLAHAEAMGKELTQ